MTKTVGYNQCNTILLDNYQADVHYLNVDLNLVKNEPIDSIEYLQQLNNSNQQTTFQYIQQHQQISPQLPPTPPSETVQTYKIETINNQLINQQNQMNQQMNQINSNNQINQINQINQQNSHQIKNHQTYLPVMSTINKQSTINQQVVAGKYRKTKNQLHNLTKPYNNPSSNEQVTRNQIRSTNSISRRNERERRRVKNVNMGFQKLRERIPNAEKKKMSKVETLKSAARYIRQLRELLHGPDGSNTEFLFSILQQNASLNAISESSNASTCQTSSNQIIDQSNDHSSSSLDYIDLAELLSQ